MTYSRRLQGDSPVKGRKPSYSRKQFENAQAVLGKSASVGEVARTTGLTRQTVYRIKDDPAVAEAALATWGMYSAWALRPSSDSGLAQRTISTPPGGQWYAKSVSNVLARPFIRAHANAAAAQVSATGR